MQQDKALEAAQYIQAKLPKGFTPKAGMILGSGLGALADSIEQVACFDYSELPGYFVSTVQGHAGKLIIGYLQGVPVICMKGRVHLYEGATFEQMRTPIRTMKRLGVENLIITNAAGVLNTAIRPGSVVLITDQINLTGVNVLVGPNDAEYGPRFSGMEEAFSPILNQLFQKAAKKHAITLPEAIYCGVMGPSYETPAEIQVYKQLGAGLVGMSTVHEVIAARHCGLRLAAISAVSNYAAGLSPQKVNHEEVLIYSHQAADNMTKLILEVLSELKTNG
ncbi:MAG: purine-nucleoside phosphorylase [Gammaproteobacteria bacterium]|jgi:inosine/guanosine/xanthosine phosphorylase family protein|nr:purine-nucleoside phosphorylase [Gammaproteobacteria bacterium]